MPPARKPFERKWTPEATAAIAWACIDRRPRMTARQAAEAGAKGELPDGAGGRIPAFGNPGQDGQLEPMPTNTAQDIVRREREARTVRARGRLAKAADAETATRIVLADAWEGLDVERARLRRAKNNKIRDNVQAWREIATTANELRKVEAQLLKTGGREATPETTARRGKTTEDTDAANLARAARSRAKAEQQGAQTTSDPPRASREDTPHDTHEHATDSVHQERENTEPSEAQSGIAAAWALASGARRPA